MYNFFSFPKPQAGEISLENSVDSFDRLAPGYLVPVSTPIKALYQSIEAILQDTIKCGDSWGYLYDLNDFWPGTPTGPRLLSDSPAKFQYRRYANTSPMYTPT